MREDNYEMGMVSQVRPDAVGAPGQRRFRLLVKAQGGSACLWLEKEQLLQLGIAIKRLMADVPEPRSPQATLQEPAVASGLPPGPWEFKVDTLTLGHDSSRNLFMLAAQGAEEEQEKPPALRFWVDTQQMNALAEEAFTVCAAGRPLCPLCGSPLNVGETHVCPKANGHHSSAEFE